MSDAGNRTQILIGGADVSGFLNSTDLSRSKEVYESTTSGHDSKTYVPGLLDGTVSLAGNFDATLRSQLEAHLAGPGQITVAPEATALGEDVFILRALRTSLGVSSPVGGVITANVDVQADGGIWPARSLHELVAVDDDGNGAGVDNGAQTTNGWVALLHVTTVSAGDSVVVTIEDSANGSDWDLLAGATFSSFNAVGAQRLAGSGTVRRHVRAVWDVTGSDVSIVFALSLARL